MTPRVRAPELPHNYPWLNTDRPLSLQELKGRVVLLDFWTYCCINCLHVLPDLKFLEQKYKDSLTVIGVHSAKFDHEKEVENIRQAILRYDIEHPVIVDSDRYLWEQYAIRAWPTLVLIDPEGYCIASLSGEGHREVLDKSISQLIQASKEKGKINYQEINFSLEKQRQPLTTPLAFPSKLLASETNFGGECLFIADSGHHRIIVSTLEGEILHLIGNGNSGLTDGSFTEAQFFTPQGMTFDEANQILYVADTENHTLRKIDFPNQRVETIAGTGEQSHQIRPHSGPALATALNSPWDLQKVGNSIFIAMAGSHQIWELQLETGIVRTYAGTGVESSIDGSLTESAFSQPSGITTDGRELYLADSEISSIRAVGLAEIEKVRTVCGSGELFGFGDMDGIGSKVLLQHCLGIEYAPDYLWIADTYNHKIKRIDPHTGNCLTMLGNGLPELKDGQGLASSFFEPSDLSAIGAHLFIADTNNHAIRRVQLDTLKVTTVKFTNLCAPDVCVPNL